MKWILLLVVLLTHSPLWAAKPYTKAQCDDLKQQKEQIRKRFNAGYGVAEGEWLKKLDDELFFLIASHCTSPLANVAVAARSDEDPEYASQTARNSSAATSAYNGLSLQEMPAWSGDNAIFKGDKVAAWTEFYQVPRQCRQKRLSEAEFVQCAEDKAQQKRRFEQRWQQLTFVPLTVGTAQATVINISATQPAIESIPAYTLGSATLTATTSSQATSSQTKATSSRYADNIQQQFDWVGITILVLLAIGSWLIWR